MPNIDRTLFEVSELTCSGNLVPLRFHSECAEAVP